MVRQIPPAFPHGVQYDAAGASLGVPLGHVAVFNAGDGILRVVSGQVVDHHLAMAAKGRGDALCDLLQCLQRCGFYGLSLL